MHKFKNLFLVVILIASCLAKRNSDGKKEGKKSSKPVVLPTFDRASENVTVIIGNSAVLPCFISNLGDHKVAWIKVANMDILAIGDYKVTNDDRIKLLHGYVSDWSLSIQPVNEEDAGEYICQVNTEPQIITRVFLQVLLPPKINEEKSTISPGPIREGQTLRLYCHSEGMPAPKVVWYFRKRSSIVSVSHHKANEKTNTFIPHNKNNEQIIHEGDTLVIKNVSRAHSGIYECIANNSVPPAASRKIRVSVEFAPEIQLQSEKVEQFLGLDARFECRIKANPLVNHYWMKDDRVIENSLGNQIEGSYSNSLDKKSSKYEMIIYNQNNNEHLTVSALIIKNITKKDFGVYQCFAVNALNTSKAEVLLKELYYRRTTTTKASVSRILVYSNNQAETSNSNSQMKQLNANFDSSISENILSQISNNKDYRMSSPQPRPSSQSKHQRKNLNTSKLNHLVKTENYKSVDDDYYDENRSDDFFNGQRSSLMQRSSNSVILVMFLVIAKYFIRWV